MGFDPGIFDAFDHNAFAQFIQLRLIGLAIGAHAIFAQPSRRGQFEHAGETTIIGEQQQPFGVDVETTDGNETWQAFRQCIENGRATFGVAIRRHKTARLVEHKQARALALSERLAIHRDAIFWRHIDGGALKLFAIHGNAALRNPKLGIATRAQADARHDFGNAFASICGGRLSLRRAQHAAWLVE